MNDPAFARAVFVSAGQPKCITRKHDSSRRATKLGLGFLVCLLGLPLAAQTNIAISATPIQTGVKRLGINLGGYNYYDSGQILKNYTQNNPGFEPSLYRSTVQCGAAGSKSGCTDNLPYGGWTGGFWPYGSTVTVISGAASGCVTGVNHFTAPGSGVGGVWTFTTPCSAALAAGDYFIVSQTINNPMNAWWPTTTGNGAFTINTTDLPPGTTGVQTIQANAPTVNDSCTLTAFFDATAGKSFINLNGNFQIQFKAKGLSGSQQVQVIFARGTTQYVSQTVSLTPNWANYTVNFSAAETGTQSGNAGTTFKTVGADSFYLDDVATLQVGTSSSNPSNFRDAVVSTLQTLKPGIIRMWDGAGLTNTLDNMLVNQFGRQTADYFAYRSTLYNVDSYSIPDFLQLVQTVGASAEAWIVVPITFSPSEASNLIDYLSGGAGTTYGAKRIAQGFVTPWTQVIPKIHLEFGNEAWNSTFTGGTIQEADVYGKRAQTIFAAMKANANYDAAHTSLVLGGFVTIPSYSQTSQNNCNNNDEIAVAPYMMNTPTDASSLSAIWGPTLAEPQAYYSNTAGVAAEGIGSATLSQGYFNVGGTAKTVTGGAMYLQLQAEKNSTHPVPVTIYEENFSTTGGTYNQAQLNSYVSSMGAGLASVSEELLGIQNGVLNQNLFSLTQWFFNRPDGSKVFLWGSVIDMGGPTNLKRPQFLAQQLANSAITPGATMLQTTQSGTVPTWNQSLLNTVAMTGASTIQSFAFDNGGGLKGLILLNNDLNGSYPVTFSGVNAPPTGATVSKQVLTSANITDTNESGSVVAPVITLLNNFNPATGITLPPFSETVLIWNSTLTSAGTIYYVSNTGSDSNNGTSPATPWQTVAKVNAQTFNPGDTILFQSGGLWREQLNITSSGTSSSPITFGSYGSGSQPVITAGSQAAWTQGTGSVWSTPQNTDPLFPNFGGTPGIKVASLAALTAPNQWYWDGASTLYVYSSTNPAATVEIPARGYAVYSNTGVNYVTVQNLEMRAAQNYGFHCYAATTGCSNWILTGNTVDLNYSNGALILTSTAGNQSTNGLAQNNTFKNNGSSGFKIGGYWAAWSVTGNQIYQNCQQQGSGSENSFCGGIYLYSASGNDGVGSLINKNTVYNNGVTTTGDGSYGQGIWTDTTTGVTISNNVAYGNKSNGIYLEKTVNGVAYHNLAYGNGLITYTGCLTLAAGQGHNSTGNLIYGNTCSGGFWDVGLNFEDANGVMSNNTLQNNIFVNSSQPVVYGAQYVNDGTHGMGNVFTHNSLGVPYSNFICWASACQNTYAAFETAYGGSTSSLQVAPGLVNPSANNFNLNPKAPARGFGLVHSAYPAPCGNPDLGAVPYPSICPNAPAATPGQTITLSSNNPSVFTLSGVGTCTGCGVADATSVTYTAPVSVVPASTMQGCPVLPNDSVFSTPVGASGFALQANSSTWLASGHVSPMPLTLQPSWGITYADASTPTTSITPYYGDGVGINPSYVTPVPARATLKRENGAFTSGAITGTTHRTLTVNKSTCGFYEYSNDLVTLSAAEFSMTETCKYGGASCNADSAIVPYTSSSYGMPSTSSDAAGLPLAPLTWTLADIKAGPAHAVRFSTSNSYINNAVALWPATLVNGNDASAAPLGARLRLKTQTNGGPNITSVCTSGAVFNQDCSNILTALTQYGMILADTGKENQIELASDVTEDPLTRQAIALIQSAAIGLNAANWDIVDESSLQQTTASGYQLPAASLIGSYAVDPSNGYVTPASYAVMSGGGTKVSIALQGIGVGLQSNTMAIAAGMNGYQIPSWVTPTSAPQGVTWVLVSGVGSVTPGGVYTPPASTSAGSLATLQATAVADPNVHANLYVSVLTNNLGTYSIDLNSLPAGSTTTSPGKVWNNDFGLEVGTPNFNQVSDIPVWQRPRGTNLPEYVQYGSYVSSNGGDIQFRAVLPNGNYKVRWMLGTPWNGVPAPTGSSPQSFTNAPDFFSVNGNVVAHFYDWNWVAGYQYATPAELFIPATVTNNVLTLAMHTLAPDAAITANSGLAPLYAGLFPHLVPSSCNSGCAKGAEAEGLEIIPDTTVPHWSIETQQVNSILPGQNVQLYVTDWYTGVNDPVWSIASDGTGLASINASTGLLSMASGKVRAGQPIVVKATDGTYTATATFYTNGTSWPLNSHR